MSLVHQMIKGAALSGTQTSAVIYPQGHLDDETGLYQIDLTSGTVDQCLIQGRLGSDHQWRAIITSGTLAVDGLGGTEFKTGTLSIYPQMRVVLTPNSGAAPTCVVSIME